MFAVLLPALNFRGNRSPYLWWFYKLLFELGEQAGYICGDEYFREPLELLADGRSDAGENMARQYQYRLPDREILDKQLREDISLDVWQEIEARYPSNPLAAFKHYCLEDDARLSTAIAAALGKLAEQNGRVEAVITCINCATLKGLCREKKLPLIHLELGPLRHPAYLQTTYFDFSGVNGGTECKDRFAVLNEEIRDDCCSGVDLRKLFMMERKHKWPQPDIDVGLCLQVEDDSNILCYSNGHSSMSLIYDACYLLSNESVTPPILVRSHPGSHFVLQNLPYGLEIDRSATSIDFVQRCRCIHTINSGLAVEALLQNRAVSTRGDSPFNYCFTPSTGQLDAASFSFFLLNYLVPWGIAFKPTYIRWRLDKPDEAKIREIHLEGFMQDKINQLESHVGSLCEQIAHQEKKISHLEEEIIRIKSTGSWRLTKPLRGAWNLFFKHILFRLNNSKDRVEAQNKHV